LDPQLKKGLLDACVLASIAREDTYGYRVTQDTVALLGVSESALYPVLRRLEQQGCFETYSREHAGRLRKYYRMTPAGEQKLAQSRAEMENLHQITAFIMEGPRKAADATPPKGVTPEQTALPGMEEGKHE